jgi:hypothetical protein
VITYTPNPGASGTDSFTYNLTSNCNSPCTPVTSNTATVTVTITGATPPPPAAGESITVTQAQFRRDQNRWTVTGTDTLVQNQVLTIKYTGAKTSTIGTAAVTATGAWTFDIRGVTGALVPAVGDQIVVTHDTGNPPTPTASSQPTTVSVIK